MIINFYIYQHYLVIPSYNFRFQMQSLDRLSTYFKEKERKRLDAITRNCRDGLPEMTIDEIKLSCLENDGYETPELNDKIYLHFRGFKKIDNLNNYTGCKSLWLDSNGFEKIENLDPLIQLRCLYISKSLINKIENLNTLVNLTILDLSYNRIHTIDNLSCCPNLQTLNISHNHLSNIESIEHLQYCIQLNNIDLTNNRLINDENMIHIFTKIPSLTSLSVNGNEITKISHFRKKMIASLSPRLSYLDRPIDDLERVTSAAFVQGGPEAENIARQNYRDAQVLYTTHILYHYYAIAHTLYLLFTIILYYI